MWQPKKCDECGEVVEGYVIVDQTVYFNGGTARCLIVLCHECQKKIKANK
jgi:hypothetical protein